MVSDLIQWLWTTCGWVFLEVVYSLKPEQEPDNLDLPGQRQLQWRYDIRWHFTWMLESLQCLTLLVGCQEARPACKNQVMGCWCGCLSGARCRLFAYGPADATASQTPSSLASFKSRLVLPFWYRLTQVFLPRGPLNGCSSSCLLEMLASWNV